MNFKQLFSPRKREGHVIYTPKERFEISKYAVENGTSIAVSRDTNQDSRR